MARPALVDLLSGIEGWDAILNDNLGVLRDTPFPPVEYANFAALPAAASYDRCLAVTTDDSRLWISNGAYWVPVEYGSTSGAYTKADGSEASSGALSGASYTFTGLFPAKVFHLGVSGRVTTLIAGATSFDVGDGTDVDMYAAGVAVAAGTTFADAATADPSGWTLAAGDVVLTAVGGNFTAGVVTAVAHFLRTVAPQG